MEHRTKQNFLINIGFIAAVGITVFLAIKFAFQYLLPFLIAFLLSYMVQRPSRYISQRTKIKKELCAVFLVAAVFLILASILGILIWQLALQAGQAAKSLPQLIEEISVHLKQSSGKLKSVFLNLSEDTVLIIDDMINNTVLQMASRLTETLSSVAANIVGKLPAILVSSVVTVVASCYLAKDYDRLLKFVKSLVKEETCKKAVKIKEILTESVLKILLGYILLMFIAFIVLSIGFLILGFKYAFLLAALIAVIDLLPVLGTGIVLIPFAVFELLTGSVKTGIGLILLYGAVILIRNVLEARIIGRQTGINPFFMLLAMFIGLKLGGVLGLLLLPLSFVVVITYYKKQIEEESENI